MAFFWLDLRTLTFWGFYMNHNKDAKSLTFGRGSEVGQGYIRIPRLRAHTRGPPMVSTVEGVHGLATGSSGPHLRTELHLRQGQAFSGFGV